MIKARVFKCYDAIVRLALYQPPVDKVGAILGGFPGCAINADQLTQFFKTVAAKNAIDGLCELPTDLPEFFRITVKPNGTPTSRLLNLEIMVDTDTLLCLYQDQGRVTAEFCFHNGGAEPATIRRIYALLDLKPDEIAA